MRSRGIRRPGATRSAALGALAAETGAEFVVVAGDVFEHNQIDPRVVSQSLEAMRAIGIPVYLLPGNHDPLDASSVYTSALFVAERPENVHVLDRSGAHDVRPGLQIVAAPWRSKAPTTDLVADALDGLVSDDVTRILVAHGGVDSLDPDPAKPSVIRLQNASERTHIRCSSLCGIGGQAFSYPSRRHWPDLVLRIAGGDQLRRRRARPRTCAGGRHRRRRFRAAGNGHRPSRGAVAIRDASPPGGLLPRCH